MNNLPEELLSLARIASAAIAEAGIAQNGADNFVFVDAGLKSRLAGGTLIQNSLNDQRIQTLTVVNTGVNSLGCQVSQLTPYAGPVQQAELLAPATVYSSRRGCDCPSAGSPVSGSIQSEMPISSSAS